MMKILFVCMGNICRSPTAEGVFRHHVTKLGLADQFHIDSAGTHNYHPGSPPDERSQQHARKRGYDLSALRARQIRDEDFETFDLILTMDHDNQELTLEMCPERHRGKVRRLSDCVNTSNKKCHFSPFLIANLFSILINSFTSKYLNDWGATKSGITSEGVTCFSGL